jgi:hypothetical protein
MIAAPPSYPRDTLQAELDALPDWLALTPIGKRKNAYLPKWSERPQTKDQIGAEIAAGRCHAVGLICGPASGLLVLDHDGASAEPLLQELLGGKALPRSWCWSSKRLGRWAAAFRVPEAYWPAMAGKWDRRTGVKAPDDGKEEGLELRWTGHQSVLIGAHPMTDGYAWIADHSPADLPEPAEAPLPLIEVLLQGQPGGGPLLEVSPPALSGVRLPLLEFVSRPTRVFVETGGTPGQWNDEQLTHTLDLIATEVWIQRQGHTAEPSAREAFAAHIAAAIQRDRSFDQRKAWGRYEGGLTLNPSPSTPEPKLLDRLAFHLSQATGGRQKFHGQAAASNPGEPTNMDTPSATPARVGSSKDRLAEAIGKGVTGAHLEELISELAAETDQHPALLQRITQALRKEDELAAAATAGVARLTAEADRSDLESSVSLPSMLPAPLAQALGVLTRYLPTSSLSTTLSMLAGVAGVAKLGTEVIGSEAAGFRVPVTLYVCLVAASGAKKSPLLKAAVALPVKPLVDELAEAYQRAIVEWDHNCRDYKPADRPAKPPELRVKTSEYTGEALAEQLAVQEMAGLGLLICRDELSALFGSMNAYRSGRGGDEQQLLELFDGGGHTALRCSGTRHYARSQVGIVGTTQHDILRKLVVNGDASGLWARFLWCPLPRRVVPLPDYDDPSEIAERQKAETFLAQTYRAAFTLPPRTYRLAPDAGRMFRCFEERRQREAIETTLGAASALHGKAAAKVLRVAGLLHILAIICGQVSHEDLISETVVDRAITLVNILDAWALGLHAEVAGNGISELARAVHKAAEALGKPVRWKEISARMSKAQRKQADADTINALMQALEEAGFGKAEVGSRGAISYRAIKALPH